MNPRFVILLAIAGALVLAAALWLGNNEGGPPGAAPAGALHTDGRLLPDLPVNDITGLRISQGSREVILRREGEGPWMVVSREGYPADFAAVAALVRKLAGLRALQSFQVSPDQLPELNLAASDAAAGASVLVELTKADGNTAGAVRLGKRHYTRPPGSPTGEGGMVTGRYVTKPEAPSTVHVVPESLDDAVLEPSAWIRRDFVQPGPPARVEVAAAPAGMNWTITREKQGSPWSMPGIPAGRTLDPVRLVNIDAMMAGLSISDVAAEGDPRARSLQDEPATISVQDFQGRRTVFTVGRAKGESLPVRVRQSEPSAPESDEDAAKAGAAGWSDPQRIFMVPRKFFEWALVEREQLFAPVKTGELAPTPISAPQ